MTSYLAGIQYRQPVVAGHNFGPHETMGEGVKHEAGAALDAQLFVQMADMVAYRLGADRPLPCDLGEGCATSDLDQDLALPRCQTLRLSDRLEGRDPRNPTGNQSGGADIGLATCQSPQRVMQLLKAAGRRPRPLGL